VKPCSSVLSCYQLIPHPGIVMDEEELTPLDSRQPQMLSCCPDASVNHAPQIAELGFPVNRYAYNVFRFNMPISFQNFLSPNLYVNSYSVLNIFKCTNNHQRHKF
jgi:hypothetical protein